MFLYRMRNYKRKTNRKNLTETERKEIHDRVNCGESRRSLAEAYGVSEKTIRNYLKKVSNAITRINQLNPNRGLMSLKFHKIKKIIIESRYFIIQA